MDIRLSPANRPWHLGGQVQSEGWGYSRRVAAECLPRSPAGCCLGEAPPCLVRAEKVGRRGQQVSSGSGSPPQACMPKNVCLSLYPRALTSKQLGPSRQKATQYVCVLAIGLSCQTEASQLFNYRLCSVSFEARVNIMPHLHPTLKFTH